MIKQTNFLLICMTKDFMRILNCDPYKKRKITKRNIKMNANKTDNKQNTGMTSPNKSLEDSHALYPDPMRNALFHKQFQGSITNTTGTIQKLRPQMDRSQKRVKVHAISFLPKKNVFFGSTVFLQQVRTVTYIVSQYFLEDPTLTGEKKKKKDIR